MTKMDPKYLQILEFPKILDKVAKHTSFSAGRELALNLAPSSDIEEVKRRQRETSEARAFLDLKASVALGGACDLHPLVKKAEIAATLTPAELLDIRATLVAARALRGSILRSRTQFPLLAEKAQNIEGCSELVAEVARCINDRAEVVDGASPDLGHIRQELKLVHDRLLSKLERMISSPATSHFLQEALITQRDGRYVIPLKADFKGRIPGVVHDTSASGLTLFIEPLSTVELNNRWRELQLEEKREMERILKHLTAQVAEDGEAMRQTVEALAELDLAFAKAKYSEEIAGVEPQLVPFRKQEAGGKHPVFSIQLINARHPLLPADEVVPINVHIGGNFFILVITGPNTGGKTVSLKTVGLLALMAEAGLHVPANEGSTLSVFSGAYADIGEEQSIEQSLSTFSSHMTNIVNILKEADGESLVLLDELGAGTDPAEGSALARAILDYLRRRHITTFVATHYPELKVYAHVTPGVQNACVEFDLETLAPTFKLSIGLPGQSNALAIAKRLGLSPEVVEEARTWLSSTDLEVESFLTDIKWAREEAMAAKEAAQAAQREAEERAKELQERLRAIEAERREIINQARQEAQLELGQVREELRRIRARLEIAPLAKEPLAQATEEVEALRSEVEPLPEPSPVAMEDLGVGAVVWVKGLQRQGEVIELFDDEVEVRIGSLRARVPLADLELQARREEEPAYGYTVSLGHRPPPSPELSIRGWRAEDVLPALDKYLNEAFLAGLPSVKIIHGKGTGVLSKLVREELSRHPLVASYRAGEEREGGDGVTVVNLEAR